MIDVEALTKQLFNEYLKWVKKEGEKDNLSNYIYWYNEVKQLSRTNNISSQWGNIIILVYVQFIKKVIHIPINLNGNGVY